LSWWIRPLVRLISALLLPLVVPAVITAALWLLPGDPAEIICPPGICDGTAALAERWGLDKGPIHFYVDWMSSAVRGDFGNSWRVLQGSPVSMLIWESIPKTALLVFLAVLPLMGGSILASMGLMPRRADALWQSLGLVPAVIFALIFAAIIQINFGALSFDGLAGTLRLVFGAVVLGFADGAFAGAVLGTRAVFEEEFKQRYVQIAILRGETVLSNALPNVLPALIGQFRGRMLHVLSGAIIVEVVLGIPGIGELLWDGTLLQDFGVVLAAAWGFALLSGGMLFAQAVCEVVIELYVRNYPSGVDAAVEVAP
jgi:peptide/nickel transport system permease protein